LVLQVTTYTTKPCLPQPSVPSVQLVTLHVVSYATAPPLSLSVPTASPFSHLWHLLQC